MDKKGSRNQSQDGMVAHTRPRVCVLEQLAYKLVHQQHDLTHMCKTALRDFARPLLSHFSLSHTLFFCLPVKCNLFTK